MNIFNSKKKQKSAYGNDAKTIYTSVCTGDLNPMNLIETTTLEDTERHFIAPPRLTESVLTGGWGSATILPNKEGYVTRVNVDGSVVYDGYDSTHIEDLKKRLIEMEVGDMKIEKIPSSCKEDNIIACQNELDLSVDRVLKTLSAIKGRLMIEIAPVHIEKIECQMTPKVRDNIIMASKKLKMYGKERPIIARFDEYGNKLPDEINLKDSPCGIKLFIVDPKEYGDYFLSMNGIEYHSEYTYNRDGWWNLTDDSLPF